MHARRASTPPFAHRRVRRSHVRVTRIRPTDRHDEDFDRLKQDAQKEIEALHNEFEMKFRARLAPVIDEVSKAKGLQFVFGLEQAAIMWWNLAVDISEDVIKRLDAGK